MSRRAGAIIMPWKTEDMRDRQMQLSSLKYYWALAHSDPTAGVQVGDDCTSSTCPDSILDRQCARVLGRVKL